MFDREKSIDWWLVRTAHDDYMRYESMISGYDAKNAGTARDHWLELDTQYYKKWGLRHNSYNRPSDVEDNSEELNVAIKQSARGKYHAQAA
jgi:hypothetical protein